MRYALNGALSLQLESEAAAIQEYRHTPLWAGNKAQSLTEFALIAPLLIGLLVGIIELGIVFAIYTGLSNTAREAARAGAVYQFPGPLPQTGESGAVTGIDAARELFLGQAISMTISPMLSMERITRTVSYEPARTTVSEREVNPLRAGDTILVRLEHRHNLFWGLFGIHEVVLSARSAHRIEPGGAQ
jgi:hypothetical protein